MKFHVFGHNYKGHPKDISQHLLQHYGPLWLSLPYSLGYQKLPPTFSPIEFQFEEWSIHKILRGSSLA